MTRLSPLFAPKTKKVSAVLSDVHVPCSLVHSKYMFSHSGQSVGHPGVCPSHGSSGRTIKTSKSSREPGLSLFQSFDDYSAPSEPLSLSPYECIPSCDNDSRSSMILPRAVSDIWGAETSSTAASCHAYSRYHRASSRPDHDKGYSDYSHMVYEQANNSNPFIHYTTVHPPISSHPQERNSVVLCLSSLIR